MLEYDVIAVSDHDEIQLSKGRRKKVETFINCVFRKVQVDWIPKFLFVLEHEGYASLAEQLTTTRPISPFQGKLNCKSFKCMIFQFVISSTKQS